MLQPGSRCLGRLRFDGSAHQSPADLSGIRLNLAPPGTSGFIVVNGTVVGNSFGPVGAPRIEPDGTFAITGIGPGAYVLNAQLPQEWRGTWTLRSAMSRGRDLLDSPMEFAPGTNIDDLVLTFSDRHTRLSGVLTAASGRPVTEDFVVAFSTDRTVWRSGSRRARAVRPGTDGHYAIDDLPGGEYFLAALTDVDPADLGDVSFLDQIVPAAIRVTLMDGEQKTQNLQIAQ